jgi:hypothetical protein
MLPELFLTKIPQECDFPMRRSARYIGELIECKARHTEACPTQAGTLKQLALCVGGVAQRAIRIGDRGRSAARDICGTIRRLNVTATGKLPRALQKLRGTGHRRRDGLRRYLRLGNDLSRRADQTRDDNDGQKAEVSYAFPGLAGRIPEHARHTQPPLGKTAATTSLTYGRSDACELGHFDPVLRTKKAELSELVVQDVRVRSGHMRCKTARTP